MVRTDDRLARDLVARGLDRREANWIIDEFAPGGIWRSDQSAEHAVLDAAYRRLDGEPLQYILGHWPFRDLDLDVDPRVLIPRPETEELVAIALGELASGGVRAPLIVDMGCGSGAIGLALLSELRTRGVAATLLAVDQSPEALEVARVNARKHDLANVTFVCSSWFDDLPTSLRSRVDLLVTNPPYVGERELAELDPVLSYEPRRALVSADHGGVVGFADFATVLSQAPAWLSERGVFVGEHGDQHGPAALQTAREAGFVDAVDIVDLFGRDRVLVARKSST